MNLIKNFSHALLLGLLFLLAPLSSLGETTSLPIQYDIKGMSGPLATCIASRLKELTPKQSLEQTLVETERAIQALLQAHGYFRSDIQATTKKTREGYQVSYIISKGPQLSMTTLAIQLVGEGQMDMSLQKKLHTLTSKQGEPMTTENYKAIKKALHTFLIAEGYIKAAWKTHTVAIDREHYTATITLIIDTGPRYTIKSIQFSAHPLRDSLVRGYLSFQEGSPYQLHKILQSQHCLEASGYFRKTLIETNSQPSSLQLPVHITLVPAPKYYTLASLDLRTDLGAQIKLEGLIRALNPEGHQLAGMAKLVNHSVDVLSLYTIPGQSPAQQKHQIKFQWTNHYQLLNDYQARLISTFFTENPTSILLSYLYTQVYPRWTVTTDARLHYERFIPSENEQKKHYRGLIFGMLLRNPLNSWSSQSNHNYHLDCKAQLAIPPFSSLSLLSTEIKGTYYSRLKQQAPLSYLILRGRSGGCIGSSPKEIPTSLRFQAGDNDYPRGHKRYLLGSHFLGGGVETRIQLAGLLYLSPFFELTYDSYYKKPIRGSTGIGLCLWYPQIGHIEMSGLIRINPDSKQGYYGFIAKISTHS